MMTMQELQEIVEQLGLIDLVEAQQYWGNGKKESLNKKKPVDCL